MVVSGNTEQREIEISTKINVISLLVAAVIILVPTRHFDELNRRKSIVNFAAPFMLFERRYLIRVRV